MMNVIVLQAPAQRLDEVYSLVEAWTMQYTKFEVNEMLNAIDVPCGPVLDTGDLSRTLI